MVNELSQIYKGFRNFLFSSVNREFLIFLFFLSLSGVFWMMLALNETYEKEVPFTVRLTGVPRNVVITEDISDTVKVTIRDKGFTLMAYLYGNVLRPVTFSYSYYANKDTGKGQIPVADVQKQIYTQLYGSSKIVSVKAERLEFYFNYGLSKKVPVRLSEKIQQGANFYLAHSRFHPEIVNIYGSKEKLDSIQYMLTEEVVIKDMNDTIREVRIRKIRGVKCVPDKVRVNLYPDVLTEESIEVPVVAINTPEGKVLRTFPSRVKVRFVVGASQFRKIKPEQFKVVVDYQEVSARPSDKCNLYLRTVPHDVMKAHLDIQQVDYLIEQQ